MPCLAMFHYHGTVHVDASLAILSHVVLQVAQLAVPCLEARALFADFAAVSDG